MEKFDYLVVGSGLYGAIFAHEAKVHGKSVLVVDKRPNIAGNVYTENVEGINVHNTSTVLTFFILIIKRFGTTLHSLQNLTVSQTHLWQITRASCIHCLLICIPSTKCGQL